ncbi:MAG: nucleoside deaminase [Bdellovibrionaceae bacterium]|nr:nucleoside deaminase [Pseudobdellovibrionaceae bacterium]
MDKSPEQKEKWMGEALALARQAAELGEVPVGAVVVHENQIVGRAFNRKESDACATHHAEILALQEASRHLGRWRLSGCDLYVTLEPCVMCAGALVSARVDGVYYGATDPKGGGVESLYRILGDDRLNHRPQVEAGILAEPCGRVLKEFFRQRRG